MFYTFDDIDGSLYCFLCKKRFDIPKLLPCGNTICSKCEKEIKLSSKLLECKFCRETHEISKKELPLNKSIQTILNMKPLNVYRGEIMDKTTKLVQKVERKCNDLKFSLHNGETTVKLICENLRKEVDSDVQVKIDKLKKQKNKLILQIDTFEEENLRNFKSNNGNILIEIDTVLNKIKEKIKVWNKLLQSEDVNEDIIDNTIHKEVQVLQSILEYNQRLFHKIFLNGKQMVFESKESELRIKNIYCIDFNRIKKTTALKILHKQEITIPDSIHLDMINDKILLCFSSYNETFSYHVKILLFENDGTLSKTELIPSESIPMLAIKNDDIYIIVQNDGTFSLKKLKFTLEEDSCEELGYSVCGVSIADDHIYLVSNTAPFIHVLNQELIEICSFGQDISFTEAYYLNIENNSKVSIQADLIFHIKNESVIEIITLSNGITIKNIEFNEILTSHLIQVNFDATLSLFDKNEKRLEIYDTNRNQIEEFQIQNLTKPFYCFNFSKNGCLLIMDAETINIF